MNNQQFMDWLNNDNNFIVILVEMSVTVSGIDKTLYLSNQPYRTSPADTPANTNYEPIAGVDVLLVERLSLDSSDSSIGAGEIVIANTDGSKDAWLSPSYVWANRPVSVFVGDARWPRADFQLQFKGTIADIDPSKRNRLSFKLRDKLQQLNTALSDAKVGGSTEYKDDLLPIGFGEMHNVSPTPENPALLKYRVGNGPIERVIEVRDNGVPLTASSAPVIDLSTGTITLVSTPAGTITASIQGAKTNGAYYNSCAQLVKQIVKEYGDASKRFTDADIDLTNFNQFDTAHPQPIGLWSPDRLNVLDACNQITSSISSQMYVSRLGLLKLIQLNAPQAGGRVVNEADMLGFSLEPIKRIAPKAAVKLGYCKNWAVQEGLLSGIPQEHKDLFAKEWLTNTQVNSTIQATYKLSGEPVQKDTLLLKGADAIVEAQRLLTLWSTPRLVYSFEGFGSLMDLELGDSIQVFSSRFGMHSGTNGVVVSLARDWSRNRVTVEFMV